jgi:hypothetical protein
VDKFVLVLTTTETFPGPAALVAGFTVKTALFVTELQSPETTTVYVPALVNAAAATVSVLDALVNAAPFLFHEYVKGPVPEAVVENVKLFVWQTVLSESAVAVVGVLRFKVTAVDVAEPQAFVITTE